MTEGLSSADGMSTVSSLQGTWGHRN